MFFIDVETIEKHKHLKIKEMKTIRTIFMVIIAALTAIVATASGGGNLTVSFASGNADFTEVEISNSEMSNFEIEVKDSYGYNLYKMKTKAPISEFKKRYDFSGLEDGIYWYSVKIDNEKVTKRFEVENGDVEVLNIRKSVEPVFIERNGMLNLSFLNFQKENIKFYIYADNSLITEADLGKDFVVHKAIDLSELNWGNYEIVIANNGDSFEHIFSVN